MFSRALLLSSLCVLAFLVTDTQSKNWETTRLIDIDHLRLVKNHYTIGPKQVPQLTCIGDSVLCSLYAPVIVDCYNLKYIRGSIKWRCKAIFIENIAFDDLDVACVDAPDSFFGDYVIVGSCGLTYSLRRVSTVSKVVGWIVGVIVLILFFSCVVFVCVRCCQDGAIGGTVYTTHSPNVISPGPAVYSTPVIAPAVVAPTYYPSPGYTTTSIGFSGTSFRNDAYDNTHVSSGFASTSFRTDDNYSSGYTGGNDYSTTDTGFAGTSFR